MSFDFYEVKKKNNTVEISRKIDKYLMKAYIFIGLSLILFEYFHFERIIFYLSVPIPMLVTIVGISYYFFSKQKMIFDYSKNLLIAKRQKINLDDIKMFVVDGRLMDYNLYIIKNDGNKIKVHFPNRFNIFGFRYKYELKPILDEIKKLGFETKYPTLNENK